MRRTNFTDPQKAQIYVRDRATCAFSGANLWLLDSGACGDYLIDWADHVKPAAGGGASAVDNGICASYLYNYAKSDSPYPGVQLFSRGVPTREFFLLQHELTPAMCAHYARVSQLHASDWSLNRAVWLVCLGLCWRTDSQTGDARRRDDVYYAKAALKRITTWRALVRKASIKSLEDRQLTPDPLQEDQKLLLTIRTAKSTDEILTLMNQLLPYHAANQGAFDGFMDELYQPTSTTSKDAFLRKLKQNRFVTAVLRKRILNSAGVIFGR